MSVEDSNLVAATRAGQTDAFERLVARHQSLVCGVAFSQTGDVSLSEDLAQEAFTIAWQTLHRLDRPARFGDWVAGIARNLGRGERKRRRREDIRSEVDDVDPRPHLDEAIDDRDTQRLLWGTLERVPEHYREVLILYYREGQSAAEVARVLEVSVTSVQQRLSRGRKYLRAEVERVLEVSLAKSRPRKTFAAAVVAGLPAREHAALTVATASGGMKMKVLIGGSAALTCSVGSITTCGLLQETPSASDAPQHAAGAESPSASRASPTVVAFARDRERHPDSVAVELPYEITRISAQRVVVNLEGGPAPSPDPGDEPSEVDRTATGVGLDDVRTVTGVVLDDRGHPVEDAIVLGGYLVTGAPSTFLQAAVATQTDGRGTFSMGWPTAEEAPVLALHREFGWSKLARVSAGDDDERLELTLESPPRLRGTVTRGGAPEAAAILLRRPGVDLWLFAGDDGAFDFDVPAAEYDVAVSRGSDLLEVMGDQAHPVGRTVRTVAGNTETLEVELPKGGMFALLVEEPRAKGFAQLGYTVVPGHHDTTTLEEVRAAMGKQPGGGLQWLLLRGDAVDEPRQFSDLPPGPYTVCATALEKFKLRGFDCKAVELGPDENREIVLDPVLDP